ncbi:MAG: hypothetical protein FJZ00_12275 [Candidatus Sericytochromatia bacterium]|uniref:Uncharacterized protein n=1 Tax=Candidatus Tanganyikabacteria bacterium TaxID=2961651 RepID=A0A937X7V8_9BACT|nr:hypothetical protein [Candidatus Tanganyikabacteria bacterium]
MDIGKSNERKQTRPIGQVGAGAAAGGQVSVAVHAKRGGKKAAKPPAKFDLPKTGKGRDWERKYEKVNADPGSVEAHAATGNPGDRPRRPAQGRRTRVARGRSRRKRGGGGRASPDLALGGAGRHLRQSGYITPMRRSLAVLLAGSVLV